MYNINPILQKMQEAGAPTSVEIKSKSFTHAEFVNLLIVNHTIRDTAIVLNCAESTLRGKIKLYLPFIESSYRTPIGTKLLAIIQYMRCYKCKEILPYSSFYASKHTKNNLQKECKSCLKDAREHTSSARKEKARIYRQRPEVKKQRSFHQRTRQASKLKRTPEWADMKKIEDIYHKCPKGYEVDHIFPLQGKLVSGLHVPENLQYLTKEENRKKSNKFNTQ